MLKVINKNTRLICLMSPLNTVQYKTQYNVQYNYTKVIGILGSCSSLFVVEFKYVFTHRVSFEFAIGTSKKCRNILEFSIIRIL